MYKPYCKASCMQYPYLEFFISKLMQINYCEHNMFAEM